MERNIQFDLRTCDAAYDFLLNILGLSGSEFLEAYFFDCNKDFETLWKLYYDKISHIDITNIKIMAFHITASLDDCADIKKWGLLNLQEVLSRKTAITGLLSHAGVEFDISSRTMTYMGKSYDIDYGKYQSGELMNHMENPLERIAYRVFYDYCADGFLMNDRVEDYGGRVHECPEFLRDLGRAFPELRRLSTFWREHSNAYRIDFYVYPEQVQRFTFDLDNMNDPPYEGWLDLSDDMKMKKWMISHALDRAYRELSSEIYLYVNDKQEILPEQIISYTLFRSDSE